MTVLLTQNASGGGVNIQLLFSYYYMYLRIHTVIHSTFIQYLNLSHNRIANADEAVKIFVVNLPNLLMIDLSYTSISDATLRNIGTYCLNLQILKLAQCTNFSSKGLYYLGTGKGCRILRHIDMSGCLQITTAGITIFGKLYQIKQQPSSNYFQQRVRLI